MTLISEVSFASSFPHTHLTAAPLESEPVLGKEEPTRKICVGDYNAPKGRWRPVEGTDIPSDFKDKERSIARTLPMPLGMLINEGRCEEFYHQSYPVMSRRHG